MPSTIVKLSDLERPLPSLAPLAELLLYGGADGRPFGNEEPSCGVVLLPIGVANRNCGGVGRDDGRCIVAKGGRAGREGGSALLLTGFWLGEGGIASPRRGVLGPPLLRFAPGTGGLRSGAGDGVVDTPAGVAFSTDLLRSGLSSISGFRRVKKILVLGVVCWLPRSICNDEGPLDLEEEVPLLCRVCSNDISVSAKSPLNHHQSFNFI